MMNTEILGQSLYQHGYALLPSLLSPDVCKALIRGYDDSSRYRKTIDMQRYRFGRGEYKYFHYPLPDVIQQLRNDWYAPLASIANEWATHLNTGISYPETHAPFLAMCATKNQVRPTPLILRYTPGGFNTLHQDLYGDVYFPFQIVMVLNQHGFDFTGGEFVMTEQIPRAQSKALVIQPNQGDAVVFTTHSRPIKGTRGYYRANMKHGISEVKSGERYALGIIFHDAT
ncbi:MAG: hypothetical protein RI909_525 [Bacteroidota bacterium]|jgi:hypothetical protein